MSQHYTKSDGVRIWRANLDLHAPELERLKRFLSIDEIERAGRYYFPKDRDNFIAARGLLRLLLGEYLAVGPEQIRFVYGARGKPILANVSCGPTLYFNVAHSGGLALFAITRAGRVGIDVEQVRTDFDCQEIADRFFSLDERGRLSSLPETARRETFFQYWTLKEAYSKALGEGLSLAMDRQQVAEEQANGWSLHSFIPMAGYVGALAVEVSDCRIELLEYR